METSQFLKAYQIMTQLKANRFCLTKEDPLFFEAITHEDLLRSMAKSEGAEWIRTDQCIYWVPWGNHALALTNAEVRQEIKGTRILDAILADFTIAVLFGLFFSGTGHQVKARIDVTLEAWEEAVGAEFKRLEELALHPEQQANDFYTFGTNLEQLMEEWRSYDLFYDGSGIKKKHTRLGFLDNVRLLLEKHDLIDYYSDFKTLQPSQRCEDLMKHLLRKYKAEHWLELLVAQQEGA